MNTGKRTPSHSGCGPQQSDVLCSGTKMFLFWCLPSVAFALGFFVSPGLKTILWTLSLGFMGALCLLNASRCGRIHCYFTGPFFILGAVTSLGYEAVVELAKARLRSLASRVQFVIGDFRKLQELALGAGTVDVVFSAYALHHLSRADKETVLRQVVELLVPGVGS
jgi:hypothetical protein